MVAHAEKLGMIVSESHPFGDVLGHDAAKARSDDLVSQQCVPRICAAVADRVSARQPATAHPPRAAAADDGRSVYPYLQSELYLGGTREPRGRREPLARSSRGTRSHPSSRPTKLGPPPPESNESYRLTLLAQIVMQMLERFFIAVGLLQQAGQHRIDRRTLENDCITLGAEDVAALRTQRAGVLRCAPVPQLHRHVDRARRPSTSIAQGR